LHSGHISLIELSKKQNGLTICSIFVNPTQFNDPKDFEKYPVTLSADTDLLLQAGCDVLFIPDVQQIYPEGIDSARQTIPLAGLDTILEGASRPGHFQGVAQVVKRLLDIVQPHALYLGQKDFQQVLVIKKMIEHFNLPVQVVRAEIVREENGLAMSSRNVRLSASARQKAGVIYEALRLVKECYGRVNSEVLLLEAQQRILHILLEAKIDYLIIVDAVTLLPVGDNSNSEKVLLVAVWVEGVRLLDNILLTN
jgi:pantoate--beta-alanine ligase